MKLYDGMPYIDDDDAWDLYLHEWWRDHPMTPEQIAESLEEAAAILEGNWTQGAWRKDNDDEHEGRTTRCAEGGLAAALGLDEHTLEGGTWERRKLTSCPVHAAVMETLALQERDFGAASWGDLPSWNDQDGRTEAEVLDLLHATAKRVLGVEP